MMLAMVPWGHCKPAGLSDSEPFHTLWRFVGANWLSASQMNDMLELLSVAAVRFRTDSKPEPNPNQTSVQVRAVAKDRTEYGRQDGFGSVLTAVVISAFG
jgi:hypothetical protein